MNIPQISGTATGSATQPPKFTISLKIGMSSRLANHKVARMINTPDRIVTSRDASSSSRSPACGRTVTW